MLLIETNLLIREVHYFVKMRSVGDYPQIDPSAYKINNRQQNLSATDLASNNENLVSAPCCTASPEVMKIRCVVTRSVQVNELRNYKQASRAR